MRISYSRMLSLFAALLIFSSFLCKKEAFSGKVMFLSGSVKISGNTAAIEQIVKPGDEIITGEKGLCVIVFNDKNIIRIESKSRVKIDGYNIDLREGTFLSVLKKLGKSFKITTPTTTASIRGTTFYVKVEDPDNTYFCDCNGIITVSDAEGKNKEELRASHHKGVRVSRKDGALSISDAGMLYHTDKDMERIAGKIGVTIDWTKIHGE